MLRLMASMIQNTTVTQIYEYYRGFYVSQQHYPMNDYVKLLSMNIITLSFSEFVNLHELTL